MRHNDTGVVIILNTIEELYTVDRRKVLLRGIQYLIIGEGCLIGGSNLTDVSLQSDNHRLVSQTETVHLMSGHTHDKSLTGSYLMVADATAILDYHRDTVLLALIDILDIELRRSQGFQVNAGECLIAAIVLCLDKTVELPVIHCLKLVALLFGEIGEILRKSITDFLNLAISKLYLLHVGTLDILTILIIANAFLNVWSGVMEGMT